MDLQKGFFACYIYNAAREFYKGTNEKRTFYFYSLEAEQFIDF